MKNFGNAQRLMTLTLLPLLSIMLYGFVAVTGLAQNSASERVLEDKTPAHLPLKVKVKNLHNKKWLDDLEIEVKNTGSKPIYFLKFSLLVPDVTSENGSPTGFSLRYGNGELIDVNKRPAPEDVAINPGESYVFKIPELSVKGW